MSESFENELRRALRPLDAPAGFAERLMRALPQQREPGPVEPPRAAPQRFAQRLGVPAAFAAALVASILLGRHVAEVQTQRSAQAQEAAGMAASRELMQALHVTSQKLDLAYQAAKAAPATPADEEDRS